MATKIGDLFFEVFATDRGARSTIEGLGRAAVDSGKLIGEAIGATLVAEALAAATAIAKISYELIQVGAAANISGQKATGLFTALTGSAEEAVALMREFAQISLDTPIFSTQALQDTTRTLLAYGVAKEDVLDMSVALNSAATALGIGAQGADRLALALGQVKGKGFFSAEEARQLGNYGVNAYKLIADAVGLTVAQVRQLGKEHKLLADDVLPIITEQLQKTFGPVAANLINTYGVQVQGLKNIFTGIGSALVQPFIGRTGGGAVVDFLAKMREELSGVIEVGDDGVYRLSGRLSGLNDVTQALADGFAALGESFLGWIQSAAGGGGLDNVTSGLANAIPDVVSTIQDLAGGTMNFIADLADAIKPILPDLAAFGKIIYDFAVESLPIAADATVDLVAALATTGHELAQTLLPVLVALLPAVTEFLQVVADLAQLFRDWAPVIGPVVAALLLLNTAVYTGTGYMGAMVLGLTPAAAAFASLAAAIGLTVAALSEYAAIKAGVQGGNAQGDLLFGDQPFFMKPVQKVAQFGFGLGGGTDELAAARQEYDMEQQYGELIARNTKTAQEFADAQAESGMSVEAFGKLAQEAGFKFNILQMAILDYKKIVDQVNAANVAEGLAHAGDAANLFEARVNGATAATLDLNGAVEEEIKYIQILSNVAKSAWDDVDRLLMLGPEATLDDFLRDLPKLAKDVTAAMAETGPEVIKNLDVAGALGKVEQEAGAVIRKLAHDYGLSMEQIKALFDKRGLAGVIDVLTQVTEESTKAVDPLIAKYASLGATADQVRDAIKKLNDQRQTAIKAQIDQVSAALDDAKQAAQDARDEVKKFLSGGYLDSPQEAVDKLIGQISGIGSNIEDALKQGGVRGQAAARQAIGGLQSGIADVVNAGLKAGLSGQQVNDLLQPVFQAINEEVGSARNRISSLDWSEGFTPAAGQQIADALAAVIDPSAIQGIFDRILGADATVEGLQAQLDHLQGELSADVVFTPAQVQGALDEITAETQLTVSKTVITPEAAQAVYDAILKQLNDQPLTAAVDKAVIAQQILDAAKDAENQIKLVFDSGLSFDSVGIDAIARQVSTEFYAAFNDQLQQLRDLQAKDAGFDSYSQMVAALGPQVANATIGTVPGVTGTQVEINAPITIQGAPDPRTTANETVAAMSAAAGSGGSVNELLSRYARTTGPR